MFVSNPHFVSHLLPGLSKLEKGSDAKSTPKSGDEISSGATAKVDCGRLPLSYNKGKMNYIPLDDNFFA